MSADELIQEAAVRLRESSPAAWEAFMVAVRTKAAEAAQQLVSADANQIFKAQGRAMAFQEIVRDLLKAPEVQRRKEELKRGQSSPGNAAQRRDHPTPGRP